MLKKKKKTKTKYLIIGKTSCVHSEGFERYFDFILHFLQISLKKA